MAVRRRRRRAAPATRFSRRPGATGPLEGLLILLVIAVAVGMSVGFVLPKVSPTVGKATGEFTASGPAADALAGLAVDDHPRKDGYDRNLFGYRETDEDGNGCDVRDDVLARDLTDVTFRRGSCIVESGVLDDPYTGRTIHFQRGRATSAAVQIDHVVALENAWQSGARDWDQATRYRFGNDMGNLLAVDGPANSEKGSASAAYWLPTNGAYRCDYVARQIAVKAEYALSVTSAERDAMRAVLHTCPAQELPRS
ncbi:HNH endonuclease [Bifidobacterium pullorum subsp. saeculare]|uniref:HNH endonuclease n=1 Tax=Bifidobacterium pullorum subsp. saeculare TaxID=78257 RepID=A0A938WXD8_9BIFI|nr:HNH endonuclease family protein [Bifidobacterium pullorum]MBM6699661.1 HNH endonuclease [Bifidobacterium pullorum subsp. saeculare]